MRIAKIPAEIVETKVLKFGAQTFGLFVLSVHNRVFKQCVQPLDFLNRLVFLWHRHDAYISYINKSDKS